MRLILLLFVLMSFRLMAQDVKPLTLTHDARYFDFWEGTWHPINEDNSLDTTQWFKVKRSVNQASFTEEWKMATGMKALAIRAWDKTNNKWGYVWVSDNGLYQVWDTRLVDGHWYIYREFDINGDKYLSRQSYKLQPDGTVIRLSEKSYDDKKWEVRFQQRLKKKQ